MERAGWFATSAKRIHRMLLGEADKRCNRSALYDTFRVIFLSVLVRGIVWAARIMRGSAQRFHESSILDCRCPTIPSGDAGLAR